MKIAVVAIGYNRKKDFSRLIESLIHADYEGDSVDLIMSIDNSGNKDVEEYANAVNWTHGNKITKTYEVRQGLRKHIVHCGDFVDNYDAIAVFEDDIVASPAFYGFTKQCVKKYADNDDIAGISLYTHLQNVYAKYSFIPAPSKYDAYFQQMAQSWGQVWMKKQWHEFKTWYESHECSFSISSDMPVQLADWGKNSWLKYHIKYCIEKNKYFVYPYYSLTTCFSSVGEHSVLQNNIYQVPMRLSTGYKYVLPDFGVNDAVYYDAFFERQFVISSALDIPDSNITVDLYGLKHNYEDKTRYVLTTKELPFQIIKQFACCMRPQEDNILFGISGEDFRLYDTSVSGNVKNCNSSRVVNQYIYFHKIFSNTKILARTTLALIKIQLGLKLKRK